MKSRFAGYVKPFVKLAIAVLILLCGLSTGWGNDKYYVQVIKTTNKPDPPIKGAKRIGSKLGDQLSPLRWKYYWEVERHDTTLTKAKPRKLELGGGERSIEIVPVTETKVEVRLYRGKDLARKSCHKPHDRMMAIFGGDEGERAWFIVVRRQEPQYEIARN